MANYKLTSDVSYYGESRLWWGELVEQNEHKINEIAEQNLVMPCWKSSWIKWKSGLEETEMTWFYEQVIHPTSFINMLILTGSAIHHMTTWFHGLDLTHKIIIKKITYKICCDLLTIEKWICSNITLPSLNIWRYFFLINFFKHFYRNSTHSEDDLTIFKF